MIEEQLVSSQEMMGLLKISSCELSHQRNRGDLKFIKKGNAFLYYLNGTANLTNHPLSTNLSTGIHLNMT
ncbi:MAG: hypothetical protein HRU22_09185 [Gammaproteobacteria bacterium]|nr:hypothetical protein [Gammaproteobacteria bacterium]